MDTESWELPPRTAASGDTRPVRPPAPAPPTPPRISLPQPTAAEAWELPPPSAPSAREAPTAPVAPLPLPPGAFPEPAGRAATRVPVRHPRRPPTTAPLVAALILALVAVGGLAFSVRHTGGRAGAESSTAATSRVGPGSTAARARPFSSPASSGEARPSTSALRRLVARVRVPGTAPQALDAAGRRVSYGADHLVDGDPATAWRTRGNAAGHTITVSFSRSVVLTRVGLVNGYAKIDAASGVDRYRQNRRVVRVTWRAAGHTVRQRLKDGVRRAQSVAFPPTATRTLTLTIDATTRGAAGFDDTAIGELELVGRAA